MCFVTGGSEVHTNVKKIMQSVVGAGEYWCHCCCLPHEIVPYVEENNRSLQCPDKSCRAHTRQERRPPSSLSLFVCLFINHLSNEADMKSREWSLITEILVAEGSMVICSYFILCTVYHPEIGAVDFIHVCLYLFIYLVTVHFDSPQLIFMSTSFYE